MKARGFGRREFVCGLLRSVLQIGFVCFLFITKSKFKLHTCSKFELVTTRSTESHTEENRWQKFFWQ